MLKRIKQKCGLIKDVVTGTVATIYFISKIKNPYARWAVICLIAFGIGAYVIYTNRAKIEA